MRTFADRLKHSLDERGVTQAELARHACILASAVSDWARSVTSAEHVKAEPLLRAAAFLQVNPMWLLLGTGRSEATAPSVLPAPSPAVQQRRANYDLWPFERIQPEQYYALPTHTRARICLMLDGVMLGATLEAIQDSSQGEP